MPYLGRQPSIGRFAHLDDITSSFNSACTTFSLTQSTASLVPGAASNLIISLGGVLQEPEVAYTVTGSSIIFSSAPANTQTFFGILLGDVLDVGQVSQGAVINATSLTVTGAATLSNTLAVTGAATLSNTLAVTGAVTGGTYNSQTINATASLTGTLAVTGAATLSNTLAVTGAVTGGTYNSQTINATASLTGTLTVATTVGVGAATPSSNGAGITFPATQSASTDANTLDDYEEGTWTPQLTASTSGSFTMSSTVGLYVKIGKIVHLMAKLTATSSSPVGNLQLTGIPFQSSSTTEFTPGIIGYTVNIVPQPLYLTISAGQAYLEIWNQGNNARNGAADWDDGGRISFQITYQTLS